MKGEFQDEKAQAIIGKKYNDNLLKKEDIFWYINGILHSPEYRQRFAADLKKCYLVFLF